MKIKFKNVNEFLEWLPDNELEMTIILRNLVFSCLPGCIEKISYNVPFYKLNKSVCFIWPSSVLWGKSATYFGVRLGFSQGFLMKDELNYLERGGRKQVFWKDFNSIEEIDMDILKTYLFEAAAIDGAFSKKRKFNK